MNGDISSYIVLMGLPKFLAFVHTLLSLSVDTHMSLRPRPPRRSDTHYRVLPSAEIVQVPSFNRVLILSEMDWAADQPPLPVLCDITRSSSSLGPGPSLLVKISCCWSAVSTGKY